MLSYLIWYAEETSSNFQNEKRKFQILTLDAVFHLWRDRMTFDWMSTFFFYTLSGWSKLQCAKFLANQEREAGSPANVFPSVVTLFGFAFRYDWLVWLSEHAVIGQDRFLARVLTPLDRRSSALTFLLCNESYSPFCSVMKVEPQKKRR